jgi:2-iminobutanoate/2-iminopropanoate deaminase
MPNRWLVSVVATLGALSFAACGATTSVVPPTRANPSPSARQLIGPTEFGYSNAAIYGDLVWTAGHLPFQANATDPFETQVHAVLDNLEATLNEAGAGFDTVLKTNVYLISFDDWPTFNQIFLERVGRYGLPARTSVQVAGLGIGRIEIEMVAHVRQ